MNHSQIESLNFRRQYVISPEEFECPFQYKLYHVNSDYFLYAHSELVVDSITRNSKTIYVIGNIFDYSKEIKSNKDILNDLIEFDFSCFLEHIERYTGRYVFLYIDEDEFLILTDNSASRKVYCTKFNNYYWFASQPYLLAKILKYSETQDISKQHYYGSRIFDELDGANIGDTTVFDEIKQLMPNHFIDIKRNLNKRFFPNGKFQKLTRPEVEKRCAEIIQGYMRNIVARCNVMLPVTAGKDSRLLLAASKDLGENIYYYINKTEQLDMNDTDIAIPKLLFSSLKMDFNLVVPDDKPSEEFEKVYFDNNKRSSQKYLPIIYNYYKNFSDKINLPGNIAFESYYIRRFPYIKINAKNLAKICQVGQYDFAVEYFSKWLTNGEKSFNESGIHVQNMLYWEERIANWSTQIQTYKDIAQEEINPYNSRLLTKLFLSVDYRLLDQPDYLLHKKIIKKLWPELLEVPINPAKINILKKILTDTGIYNLVLWIRNFIFSLK